MKAIEIKRNPSAFGESFYGSTVVASVDELKTLFGNTLQGEDCVGNLDDKTQHEWGIEAKMDDGEVYQFSIYDWKEYREYEDDEPITWHIGGSNKELTDAVAKAINILLKQ